MAKKKTKKETKKETFNYKYELIGLLLILISILGFIRAGIVGNFILNFATFLVGTWYALLFVACIIVGSYMIIKREKPEFLTAKLIGLYIFVIGLLLLSHIKYLDDTTLEGFDIVKETINNFMSLSGSVRANIGGGIIGSIFAALGLWLFDLEGTKIITWVLIGSGAIMFSGISIVDVIKNTLSKAKNKTENIKILSKPKDKETKKLIETKEEEFENGTDHKIVVSSIDELLHINDNQVENHETFKTDYNETNYDDNVDTINKAYGYPPISLLNRPAKNKEFESKETISHNVEALEKVLADFGVSGKVVAINPGPAVTQYEMEIRSGTKVSKISSLNKEIALALAAKDVRIEAPIPGKATIGIEIPNKKITMVTVREILESVPSSFKDSKLLVTLGKNIMGKPVFTEINKTPHLLVAGSTGSGKSVCINSIIISILMRTKPDEVKLVLVDPKKVELSMYNGVPHLLTPVVTDPRKANIALKKIVVEMERRYDIFEHSGTKNIAGYNAYVAHENEKRSENEKIKPIPYIVVIIDELADLMLVAAKEVEDSIMRITQMARAAGIHLIVATQRPSTDVITGVVKSNIPSRISFAVSSSIDSRTILDMGGAERLLGKGDMLFKPQEENTPIRIQGTFISDEEIKKVADYTIKQQKARYDETFLMDSEEMNATSMVDEPTGSRDANEEPLYNEIVEFVVTQGKASASLLQRRFRLGYNRAARAIDLLEERGIVGPANGSKPREVYAKLKSEDE